MLDPIDRQLLALLQDDARLGYQELGDAVGLSAPAVYQRVRKLEEAGALTGYHAEVAPAAAGRPLAAFVRVVPGPRTDRQRLLDGWLSAPECQECHLLTGEVGYLLKLRVPEAAELEPHVDAARRAGCTVTVELALKTVLERRRVPVF
jgi:Lrp/AsnC family leucine-responsive transcriptional regulator